MKLDYGKSAGIFKVLGDETRLKILDMLCCGEMCACDILEEFEITQPTLSYHMKMLVESGLVEARKEGKWMYYTLQQDGLQAAKEYIGAISNLREDCICHARKKHTLCRESD